jgi:hypothetical protein
VTKTPHEILGVPVGASVEDIKAARRRLALRFHPDHATGDAAAMRDINAAYAELMAAPAAPPPVPAPPANEASFVIDVLPAFAYRYVTVAAAQLGDVWTVDEPYEIEVLLYEPNGSGLSIELAPDAGGTTVTLVPDQGRASYEPSADVLAHRMMHELRSLSTRMGTPGS